MKKEPFWAGLRRRANNWLQELAEEVDFTLDAEDTFDDIPSGSVPKKLRNLDRRGEFFTEVHKEHSRITGTWKPRNLDDMLETILDHEYDTDPKKLRKYRHQRRRK